MDVVGVRHAKVDDVQWKCISALMWWRCMYIDQSQRNNVQVEISAQTHWHVGTCRQVAFEFQKSLTGAHKRMPMIT